MDKFKQSKEYAAIMTTQYDTGYDLGVEEIFFNIWTKRWDVDYRFLGRELRKVMGRWIDKKREGILNTRPPLSPQYLEAEDNDEVIEIVPPIEASK